MIDVESVAVSRADKKVEDVAMKTVMLGEALHVMRPRLMHFTIDEIYGVCSSRLRFQNSLGVPGEVS